MLNQPSLKLKPARLESSKSFTREPVREGINMLNIGVIGSGGIIGKHIMHLEGNTEARIVALCDVNEEMINKTNEKYFTENPLPGYATPQKMYDGEDLHAVIITSPHWFKG